MTTISPDQEAPVTSSNENTSAVWISRRSSKRNRSFKRSVKRSLRKLFPARLLFRASAVLLSLAAFVHVSLINDVFGPYREESGADFVEASAAIRSAPTITGMTYAQAGMTYAQDDSRINHGYALADWVVEGVDRSRSAAASSAMKATIEASTDIQSEPDVAIAADAKGPIIHVVNEGGSLWRTGKRFIDDEVLLDKLIDNLAQNGMDVRNVKPGVEMLVSNLDSEGLLVVIDADGDVYESRISDTDVETRKRRVAVM